MKSHEKIGKATLIINSIWKVLESFLSKGISMIVTIVLARILVPEDFGVIALTSVYIQLSDILIQAGFSTALIRKKDVSKEDYSTVLCISLCSSIVLYITIFLLAPSISVFFETENLDEVLRVISLSLFCQAFAAVRTAVITREMKFKLMFKCTMISNIASGIGSIFLATLGYGVWALVFQQVFQQILFTVILFIAVKIKISVIPSKKSAKELIPFSIHVLGGSLISFVGDSLYSVVIGNNYSMSALGYYDKGNQFPRQFSLYTFGAISSVLLPALSSYQDDYDKLNAVFYRVIIVTCYIVFPIMAGMSCVSDILIEVILTEKWLGASKIMRWACLYYAATPLLLANIQLHFAIGRSTTRLKIETIRLAIMLVSCIVFVFWIKVGISVLVMILSFIQIIIVVIITYETQKATGYKTFKTIKDVIPTMVSISLMCLGIYGINLLPLSMGMMLILDIVVGIMIYLLSSFVLKNKAFHEMLDILRVIKGKYRT